MSAVLTIWEKELRGFFFAPIAYVLGVAFLGIQGFSLWSLMKALSDPSAPAPVGAVLQTLFGGTLIFWLTLFVVSALLCMGSVAEARRSGRWESTVTTRATVGQILLGKFAALWSFYLLLWLPTLLLVWLFQRYVPEGASLDWGPVIGAYLACFSVGALLLSLGLLASALSRHGMVAAVLAFAFYLVFFFAGELLSSDAAELTGAGLARPLQLRLVLAECARGNVELGPLLVWSLSPALFLTWAAAWLHPRPAFRRRGAVGGALALLALLSVSSLASTHFEGWDLSRGQVNSLDGSTRRLLADIDEELHATLIRPSEEVFDSVANQTWRLLRRMQRENELFRLRELDPLERADQVARWAYELALRPEDLSSGGAVLFEMAGRKRVVDLLSMASFDRDALGVGAISTFHAESAFRKALLELQERGRELLCYSSGHGALRPVVGEAAGPHWAAVGQRLEAEGISLRAVAGLSARELEACTALVIAGVARPLAPEEVLALQSYLDEGGALWLGLRSRSSLESTSLPRTGLELLLEERGIEVLPGIVVDPSQETELAPAWMSFEGYGAHPSVEAFEGRLATVWDQARGLVLAPGRDARCLMSASAAGWTEMQSYHQWGRGVHQRDPGDREERCVAAASASQARVVVVGSALSMSSRWFDRGAFGNERFAFSTLLWLLDRQVEVELFDKRPEHLRLLMTRAQLRTAFIMNVVALPLFFALLGGFFYWWRRREP